jgi:predicted nucleic acid-binding protein
MHTSGSVGGAAGNRRADPALCPPFVRPFVRSADVHLLIASTGLAHGLTVVTHNVTDYANVPGLKVVDWLVP